MVTAALLSRARAGDGEAFRELTGPHRRELQVHCYRMLGSFADAEDAVQETMLAAWQGIGGFTEERASLRTWLYKIATNRCLNARRAASRRPARAWDVSQFEPPVPTPRVEAPVGGDLVQPGAQRGAFLGVPADALPGGQHRFLDGVFGVGEGSEHPVAVHLQLPPVRPGQLPERLAISGPCS